jgi:hypothetical protein
MMSAASTRRGVGLRHQAGLILAAIALVLAIAIPAIHGAHRSPSEIQKIAAQLGVDPAFVAASLCGRVPSSDPAKDHDDACAHCLLCQALQHFRSPLAPASIDTAPGSALALIFAASGTEVTKLAPAWADGQPRAPPRT